MLYCACDRPHHSVLRMQLYSVTLAGEAAGRQACLPQCPRREPSSQPWGPRRQRSVRCASAAEGGDGVHAVPSSSGSHSDSGRRQRQQALPPTGSPPDQAPVPACFGRRQIGVAALSTAAAAAAGALPEGWARPALAAAAPGSAQAAQQLREFKVGARGRGQQLHAALLCWHLPTAQLASA